MTRFAKHKKAKKPVGEDATPWKELKEPLNEEEDKRKEDKRLEKQRKRQLKKVFFSPINKKKCFINKILDLFSMSNTWTFNE